LTKAQVEDAAKKSLAEHFGVNESGLTATATESHGDHGRRLADTWTIAYEFFASPAQVASVNAKVTAAMNDPDAFKTSLASKFIVALKAAGVSASVADALTVTAATAAVPTSTATTGGEQATSAASKTVAFISFVIVIKTLFSSM